MKKITTNILKTLCLICLFISCNNQSEWIYLFDGQTTDGWRAYNGTEIPEKWTVVEGELTIVLNEYKHYRLPGESIHIELGAHHRAWNQTDEPVTFIEVQTGTYFGEDDIVRLEDDYSRN